MLKRESWVGTKKQRGREGGRGVGSLDYDDDDDDNNNNNNNNYYYYYYYYYKVNYNYHKNYPRIL